MPTKTQHTRRYKVLPPFLKEIRKNAGLTQRALGALLGRPQSWVYNCETSNRRVDVTEFISWSEACGVKPQTALLRLVRLMNG